MLLEEDVSVQGERMLGDLVHRVNWFSSCEMLGIRRMVACACSICGSLKWDEVFQGGGRLAV